jgi:hypothetical protein
MLARSRACAARWWVQFYSGNISAAGLKVLKAAAGCRALLRGVRDAPRTLARLQTMQTLPDPTDFLALQESLAATLRIR